MDVEVLGVLRGARGPGQDMILVQLHGTKPEYTGVVAGMSGSPVYVDGRLMGALAYRIGQFARDPIAGITPIEQMLEVRDLPLTGSGSTRPAGTDSLNMKPMETPLTMSGFGGEAIRFWQERMAGTGLETVAAGGASSAANPDEGAAEVLPGSAVSALLVRGDMEIAATCTVTYIDPKQLLACGHPLYQLGTVQLPMTATEVVATLASPLNAFKIVNTGAVIGTFTEDRDAAIRGELGRKARMIPMQIVLRTPESGRRVVKVEILDQPGLTEQAAMVVTIQALIPALSNTAVASYHVKGAIRVAGMEAIPLDLWAVPTDAMAAPIAAAIQLGDRLGRIHANSTRLTAVEGIDLEVEALPRKAVTELRGARLLGSTAVHAGDTVEVEATLQPFQSEARKVRLSFRLPARMTAGTVRLLLSDAPTLDRALGRTQEQGQAQVRLSEINAVAAEGRTRHPADRLYLSLLEPVAQATMGGQTLSDLPLSVVNSLEPMRAALATSLNGETAEVVAEVEAGELITGFEVLTLHMEAGAGLN